MLKPAIFVLTLMFSTSAFTDDAEDAAAKLYEYFSVFNQKDVTKVAHEIYATPVQVGGATAHRIYANPEEAIASLTSLYTQIESQGWAESRIHETEVCIASDSLALVDTRYSRLDSDGNAIAPEIRTTLYVLQKRDDEWRIVAFYGHDTNVVPTCRMANP